MVKFYTGSVDADVQWQNFLITNGSNLTQPLHLPLAVKAGEPGLAGQELLHGGLLEVALLGDEPIQSAQQCIHIAQRRRDGALFVTIRG